MGRRGYREVFRKSMVDYSPASSVFRGGGKGVSGPKEGPGRLSMERYWSASLALRSDASEKTADACTGVVKHNKFFCVELN